MKKNKISFAAQAQRIMKKYPRASFDKAEKDAMEQELDALIQQQEAMKQAMGLNAPTEQQMELDTNQAMMEGQMEEPQMFWDGGNLEQSSDDYPNGSIYQRTDNPITRGINYVNHYWKNKRPALFQTPLGSLIDPASMLLSYLGGEDTIGLNGVQGGAAFVPSSSFKGLNIPGIKLIPHGVSPATTLGTKPKISFSSKPDAPSSFNFKPSVKDIAEVNAPLSQIGGKTRNYKPKANAFTKKNPEEAIMDALVNAPGNLGKEYPTGVRNLSHSLNIPWRNIGYGAAGVSGAGLIGAGIYGANQVSPEGNTQGNNIVTPTSPTSVSGNYRASLYDPESSGGPLENANPTYINPNSTVGKIWNSSTQGGQKIATSGNKNTTKTEVTSNSTINQPINNSRESINMLPMKNSQGMVPGGRVQREDGTFTDPYRTNYMGATVGGGFASGVSNKQIQPLVTDGNLAKTIGSQEMNKLSNRVVPTVGGGGNKQTNEFLPSYIAAGANVLGNVAQMFLDKKPKDVNFARYTPEEIDLTEQRLAAEREADLARSVGRTTARNTGMNAGQAMSNIMSSESGVSRNLSNALLQSRLAEQAANVGERNRAGQINAEIGMKETMTNRSMQDAQQARQREYLAGAVQTIPDTMKDINQIKAQLEYLKMMGMSEENALKWLSQKNPDYVLQMMGKQAVGTLFKQKE